MRAATEGVVKKDIGVMRPNTIDNGSWYPYLTIPYNFAIE
jgi:hypothetical protein